MRNTPDGYGLVAIALHWLTAIAVIAMFPLGLWMVGLGYYDPWYRSAPAIHKGLGVLLMAVVVLRLGWRYASPRPAPPASHRRWERRAAVVMHAMLYLLLLSIGISGYLISTADGRSIDVFGWFQLPATLTGLPNQADLAGEVHLVLAIALVTLVFVHAGAALKHYFVDRDATLLRMLWPGAKDSNRG